MAKCFMLDCEGEAKYFIRDAEQDPKEYNGKKICAECFEASCGGHDEYEAEAGPSPLDYAPLTEAPSGEGGPPAGPSDSFEADGSGISMAAGVGLVVGLIAAYKYSDKISDLFSKMADE